MNFLILNNHSCAEKISRHIIIAQKHNKNKDLEKYYKERAENEFEYLKDIIDDNRFNQARLLISKDIKYLCRYADIRPYEDNFIELNSGNIFINASWIHIPYPYYFISTQGPLKNTVEDFFQMCRVYDVKLIVMLCEVIEDNKEKCVKYWDIKGLNKYEIGKRNETTFLDKDKDILFRQLTIRNVQKKEYIGKDIDQIQFIAWEDHQGLTYQYFEKIIKIIEMIDDYKKRNKDIPVVIHCSAGVGRTGTFICLYNLYHEIMQQIKDKEKKEIKFSIMNLVRKIKEMRMFSVENEYQYKVLYLFTNYILNYFNV